MDVARQRVLVTGAGGFIGSALVRALIRSQADVIAFVGPPGGPLLEPPAGVSVFNADVRFLGRAADAFDGLHAVVHLAGPPSVQQSFDAPADYASVHVAGTASVLDAARRAGVPRFIYISSAEVYGRSRRDRVREDDGRAPRSPYGAAKAAAEHFVEAFRRSYGMHAIILRPFSVYGPGLSPQSLIGTIVRQGVEGSHVYVSDATTVRDYCYVDDLGDAVVRACSTKCDPCVLNVGSGTGSSVAAVVRILSTVLGRDLTLAERTTQGRRSPRADISYMVADASRALDVLGWKAQTSMESGLRSTVAWHAQSSGC